MMRSVHDAPGAWIAVPNRSRIRWGAFEPDQPAPQYLLHAYDRMRATGRWYASATRAVVQTSRAVVDEGATAMAARMRGWTRPAREVAGERRRRRSRINVIFSVQRNMIHLECRRALPQ